MTTIEHSNSMKILTMQLNDETIMLNKINRVGSRKTTKNRYLVRTKSKSKKYHSINLDNNKDHSKSKKDKTNHQKKHVINNTSTNTINIGRQYRNKMERLIESNRTSMSSRSNKSHGSNFLNNTKIKNDAKNKYNENILSRLNINKKPKKVKPILNDASFNVELNNIMSVFKSYNKNMHNYIKKT